MKYIAILGYGTVGKGIASYLLKNKEQLKKRLGEDIEIKWILDIRKFLGDPFEEKITHDFADILADKQVTHVIETMGGLSPAYEYTKALLASRKHVCSSNKALVEAHGAQLMKIAREKSVNYLFEASVGGGIPLLRTLYNSLSGEKILKISGILNGTTNYILTQMRETKASFQSVLKEAQDLGYAEFDPTSDVLGQDTARKLAILASIGLGKKISIEDFEIYGIEDIDQSDIKCIHQLGGRIKLVGEVIFQPYLSMIVEPRVIFENHPLYQVEGVFNGILIQGNMVGDITLIGQGAGAFPTASAIVSDLIHLIENSNKCIMNEWDESKVDLVKVKVLNEYFCYIKRELLPQELEMDLKQREELFVLDEEYVGFIIKASSKNSVFELYQNLDIKGVIRVERS